MQAAVAAMMAISFFIFIFLGFGEKGISPPPGFTSVKYLLEEELLGLWKNHGIDDVNHTVISLHVSSHNLCVVYPDALL